jgi:prepilin-type N-terminal cleavage/methylation domain-containing protein
MKSHRQTARTAFTLVEILIVVVIMAVLAATIIPQFSASTKDAQESTVVFNLQAVRSQIELYKAQHNGTPPSTLDKLAARSNSSGTTGTDATAYPFGPYMLRLPENPLNGKSAVDAITTYPPTAVGASTAGWLYHSTSGNVYINDAAYFSE